MKFRLLHGDCLEEMKVIPTGSVDMVMVDPPYGTTQCKWDVIIPLEPMWVQIRRVTKKRGAVVIMANQPFTTILIHSNLKEFKYCWVWRKNIAVGHLVAKKKPMTNHEDVVVFYRSAPTYNPEMVKRDTPVTVTSASPTPKTMGGGKGYSAGARQYTHTYPKTVLDVAHDTRGGHPTQKPVALMEYMIKTYTNEGETVLDFAMGSGTTGEACINLNRNFIGIEIDEDYFQVAQKRLRAFLTGDR